MWKSDDNSFLLPYGRRDSDQVIRFGGSASPGELQPRFRHCGHTGRRCSWAVLPPKMRFLHSTGLCTVFLLSAACLRANPCSPLCTLEWSWILRGPRLISTIASKGFRFSGQGPPFPTENTFSQIEPFVIVSLFLNPVPSVFSLLSFHSWSNPLKTTYFLAWSFRHSSFLQRQNFLLFSLSSHYLGWFPWWGEEHMALPFSIIFLLFSTPKQKWP